MRALKEIGFELRSRGPLPLPPLINAPRRSATGHSEKYLVPKVAGASKDDDKKAAPSKDAPGVTK